MKTYICSILCAAFAIMWCYFLWTSGGKWTHIEWSMGVTIAVLLLLLSVSALAMGNWKRHQETHEQKANFFESPGSSEQREAHQRAAFTLKLRLEKVAITVIIVGVLIIFLLGLAPLSRLM